MLGALKKLKMTGGSSLHTTGALLHTEAEEVGTWHYLVVDTEGIRPRKDACYNKDSKRSDCPRILEGTLHEINRIRRSGWTRWLGLASQEGWVFDISPKDNKVRMIEVEVLTGEWYYQVLEQRMPVLRQPSLQANWEIVTPGLPVVKPGESIKISERIRPVSGKGSFLRMADGSGYVLDFFNGRQLLQRSLGAGLTEDAGFFIGSDDDDVNDVAESLPDTAFIHNDLSSSRGYSHAATTPALLPCGIDVGAPELGEWTYVVLDAAGIRMRCSPTYDAGSKLPNKLAEGELIKIVERRSGNGTTFLRLQEPRGWVFDVQPGKVNRKLRMAEVKVEHGTWLYRISASKGVALRSRCSFAEDAKTREGPKKGALVTVTRRVRVGGTMFLRVDGSWIFDSKSGKRVAEGPIFLAACSERGASVRSLGGVNLRLSPTGEKWAWTQKLVVQGARVQVDKFGEVEEREWTHVFQTGGMDGWVPSESLELDGITKQSDGSSSNSPFTSTSPVWDALARAGA